MIGATYRVQFRNGFTFGDAARIVPHLARVGITHLYASPIFAATDGSTHGYDVTDHNVLDPQIGGEAGFEEMSAALREHGLGLILDIVPNHMAASMENGWWRDVAMHGQESRYAKHFDIDWDADKLILPILGKPFGDALADGDIVRKETPVGPVLAIPGDELPLAPGTEEITDVAELHEAQHYRLAHWRIGRDGLTYRRFFEVTGLVGVRVEDDAVFEDVHRLILQLVSEGKVDAVRVDHVDGLADPAGYLKHLAERSGIPVLVEKILGPHETVRPSWPIEGTTGYEFIAGMADLFANADGLSQLSAEYEAIGEVDIAAMARSAKKQIITENLAGELERLSALALRLFADDLSARDHGATTVREGIVALLVGMPVYRTYLPSAEAEDRAVLEEARTAAEVEPLENPRVLDDLVALLLTEAPDEVALEFISRVQQTSGPLMAKAIEDTLFYRHHRLLALNEVGGDLEPEVGAERYLRVAAAGGLAATQTHDTKRGEDARARLYALSDPEAVGVWSRVWQGLPGEVPEKLRWALGQMLFGSTPLHTDPDFTDRFREAALKTVREAKEETTWTRPDEAFEANVAAAAEAMVEQVRLMWPLADVRRAGAVIGLGQALLKTTARPAPDIYQGTLGWDFSMVDPDNRRPVDYPDEAKRCDEARSATPEDLATNWQDGRIKARVLIEGIAARRERPELFTAGSLHRLPLTGSAADSFAAFLRESGDAAAVMVIPLRPLPFLAQDTIALDPAAVGDLALTLPRPLVDRFTGADLPLEAGLAELFARFPIIFATSWAR